MGWLSSVLIDIGDVLDELSRQTPWACGNDTISETVQDGDGYNGR